MPPVTRHPRHHLVDTVRNTAQQGQAAIRRQFGVSDVNGTLRVGIGALGAFAPSRQGDYGIIVGDPSGNLQTLSPPVPTPLAPTTILTTSTELTTVGNRLTTYIGTSGRALVTLSAQLFLPASRNVIIGVYANGTEVTGSVWGLLTFLNPDPTFNGNWSVSGSFIATTARGVVASANNLWTVFGTASTGTPSPTVTFGTLIVQPL